MSRRGQSVARPIPPLDLVGSQVSDDGPGVIVVKLVLGLAVLALLCAVM